MTYLKRGDEFFLSPSRQKKQVVMCIAGSACTCMSISHEQANEVVRTLSKREMLMLTEQETFIIIHRIDGYILDEENS